MANRQRFLAGLAIDLLLIGLLVATGPRVAGLRAACADPQGWLDRVGPDAAAVAASGLVCWAMLLWVTAGLLLLVGAALPGAAGRAAEAIAGRVVPAAVRRMATLALGASLGTATVVGTAAADQTPAATAHAAQPLLVVSHVLAYQPEPGSLDPPDVDWPLGQGPVEPPPQSCDGSATPMHTGPVPGAAAEPGLTTAATASLAAPGSPASDGSTRSGPVPVPASTTKQERPETAPRSDDRPCGARLETRSVVVERGDSLWLIAARRLGPQASAAETAREWPRWYAMNRHVIGDEPDFIRPGQTLVAPGPPRGVLPIEPPTGHSARPG
jgi:nucleoid-associated protein YgaU